MTSILTAEFILQFRLDSQKSRLKFSCTSPRAYGPNKITLAGFAASSRSCAACCMVCSEIMCSLNSAKDQPVERGLYLRSRFKNPRTAAHQLLPRYVLYGMMHHMKAQRIFYHKEMMLGGMIEMVIW